MLIMQANKIYKTYGNKFNKQEVLRGIDLQVDKGEFVGIMGPSGSGKTTLLNVLSSIDRVSKGTIEIEGKEFTGMKEKQLAEFRKHHLGFIFQDYNLLDTLTVKENIMLPLSITGMSKKEAHQKFDQVAGELGIYELKDKYPAEISGGQKQRTSAARAFVHDPSIIFADEPTGALDSKSASDLLNKLAAMNSKREATIVMVTHDAVAASYCSRVVFIRDGQIYTQLNKGRSRGNPSLMILSAPRAYLVVSRNESELHYPPEPQKEHQELLSLRVRAYFQCGPVLLLRDAAVRPGHAGGQRFDQRRGCHRRILCPAGCDCGHLPALCEHHLHQAPQQGDRVVPADRADQEQNLRAAERRESDSIFRIDVRGDRCRVRDVTADPDDSVQNPGGRSGRCAALLPEALQRTVLVFAAVYMLIMIMNYTFIRAQSILSLFKATATSQTRIQRMSLWEVVMGVLGIGSIIGGYYISGELFSGKFTGMNGLMFAMIAILALVIIGTYLFYKGSVSFLFNLIRRSKKGYLSIREVLSLSSIMFRMKSNALLLTVITTVSALAIGLLSLSYISYYSVESSARESSPHDYGFLQKADEAGVREGLDQAGIGYTTLEIPTVQVEVDLKEVMDTKNFPNNDTSLLATVISESSLENIDLQRGEVRIIGYTTTKQTMLKLKDKGELDFSTKNGVIKQQLVGLSEEAVLPYYFGGGILGVFVVDDSVFQELLQHKDPDEQKRVSGAGIYYGINLSSSSQAKQAYEIYKQQKPELQSFSQYEFEFNQRTNMGLIMFIVGFLGLTFLITSGCILYFKQMDESEEEREGYTILRKLGFTQGDLLSGIRFKQLFNFGIPLIVGLCHSYFAVKSGWFFFGTEMLTPMFVVMGLYTVLYSIFGLLSVLYYKRVIRESL